jgi:hypothetical protein
MDLWISYHHGLDFAARVVLLGLHPRPTRRDHLAGARGSKNREVLARHLRHISTTQPMYQCDNFRRVGVGRVIDREAA